MTDEHETCSVQVIEFCRRFNRRMAEKQVEVGASPEDVAIGAIYSAVDLAQHHAGDATSAIAWARRALDVMEAQLPLTSKTIQ